ncbi:hypothetical protein U0070_015762 [Myodes glareolus]|uniref:Uncharacterized protein n=1 Tax=Myodes glareolus TaxID=447135 RepID=A0AAW0H0Z3_MYOGA
MDECAGGGACETPRGFLLFSHVGCAFGLQDVRHPTSPSSAVDSFLVRSVHQRWTQAQNSVGAQGRFEGDFFGHGSAHLISPETSREHESCERSQAPSPPQNGLHRGAPSDT